MITNTTARQAPEQPLSCVTQTSLSTDQQSELYRYLKMTRMKEAVEYARGGNGSVLLEVHTYRRKGHAEHDNQSYVPDGEIAWWAEHNDTVTRYEKYLVESNVMSREEMDKMVKDLKTFLDAEADWAETQPDPTPESAAYEVYDNSVVPPAFKRKVLER